MSSNSHSCSTTSTIAVSPPCWETIHRSDWPIAFIKPGWTSPHRCPGWPAYTLEQRISVHFDTDSTITFDDRADERILWNDRH